MKIRGWEEIFGGKVQSRFGFWVLNLGCLLDIQKKTSSNWLYMGLEFRGESWSRDTKVKVLSL